MNLETIRIQLIRKGLRLKDISRVTGIDYDRLQKVVNGYRTPKPHEIIAIARVLELPVAEITGE